MSLVVSLVSLGGAIVLRVERSFKKESGESGREVKKVEMDSSAAFILFFDLVDVDIIWLEKKR
jgi:hypothetical protein